METKTIGQSKRKKPHGFFMHLIILAIAGGVAFWVTSIVTSLLPIAAKYRAALSNWSAQSVWIGSLIAGIIFGCCISYFLIRFYEKIPSENPILKSIILSSVVLVIATILIDIPMVFHAQSDALHYFLIGFAFNLVRFLFLGIVVGYLYHKLNT